MTNEQFDVIAQLIRSREPTKSAARMVLIDKIANVVAASKWNLKTQSVANTVARFRAADMLVRRAYSNGKP